jgi:hypothetical protein
LDPAESRVVQLARQIAAAGLRASKAYNEAQAALDLDRVLTPVRWASRDGTAQSLTTLARLSALTVAHKEMFARFVTTAMGQLAAAAGELPENRAAQFRDEMVRAVNGQFAAQTDFYQGREEWIAAAIAICELIDSHRDGITFTETGLIFAADDVRSTFDALARTVNRIHRQEVEKTTERVARLSAFMAALQTAPP